MDEKPKCFREILLRLIDETGQLAESIRYSINLSGQLLGDDAFTDFVEDQFHLSSAALSACPKTAGLACRHTLPPV